MVVRANITMAPIWNVVTVIPGELDPEHVVVLGNHRDAWVAGAIDPTSGTAAVLETGRALSVLRDQGWRPRRTISGVAGMRKSMVSVQTSSACSSACSSLLD